MNTIAGSKESPRYNDEKDILYWFSGDAFSIDWTLRLVDCDTGEPIAYQPTDTLIFSFFDIKKNLIKQFTFTDIQNDTVTTVFTPVLSKKFVPGNYSYCIKFTWTDSDGTSRIQTLVDNKKIKVEVCH